MRIASRHMPRLARRPAAVAGWLFVACSLAAIVYFVVTAPMAFFVAAIVLAMFLLLAHQHHKRKELKLHALVSRREGQTICEFARDFNAREVDTWIIRAVYEQLQEKLKHVHPSFPVRADDRLKEDLLLDDDDLDMDLAQEVEARTGRSLDASATNPYFGSVGTVRDFVLFFQNQPRSSSATCPIIPANRLGGR